jgi:cation diffusion facilitator CzcD-associated flavoprotein CzcO
MPIRSRDPGRTRGAWQISARQGVGNLPDGTKIVTRATIHATAFEYRGPNLPNEDRFPGRGVYYGAGSSEASLCNGSDDVFIVGGGNSARQAAMHFARVARMVYLAVRGPRLKRPFRSTCWTASLPTVISRSDKQRGIRTRRRRDSGDHHLRHGSVKRYASAVGEEAMAVAFVQRYLIGG